MTPNKTDAAKLVAELRGQATDLENCDKLPRAHRDTEYEIEAAIGVLKRAAAFIESHSTPTEYNEGALREALNYDDKPTNWQIGFDMAAFPLSRRLSQVTAERDELADTLRLARCINWDGMTEHDELLLADFIRALSHITTQSTEEQSAEAQDHE